jgi:hypothetical protein
MRRVRQHSRRGVAWWVCFTVLPWCFWTADGPLLAQNASTGALVGTVMDVSGSVVAGAQVRILNEITGEQRLVSTNDVGAFVVPLLPPSSYRISVAQPGFKLWIASSVAVNVTESTRVHIQLEVGAQTETVNVDASADQLQTDSAELGRVTSQSVIESLPLVTRNYTQIVGLNPGISSEVTNAGALGAGGGGLSRSTGYSANGNRTDDNNVQLNGIDSNDVQNGGTLSGGVPIPNPDAIEQFKVVTQPYDAANGRNGGAVVDLITKSGSNQFHGSAFEYFRNEDLNANTYFGNATGQPRPVLRQNQYGAAIGGPVKQDKLLFFGSYQGTKQKNGLDPSCATTDLLPPLTNDRSAAALGSIFAGQQSLRTVFGPNGVGPAILADGSNINPAALAALQRKNPDGSFVVPTPQRASSGGSFDSRGFASFSSACPFDENQFVANTQFLQSEKSQFNENFFFADNSLVMTMPTMPGGGTAVPGAPFSVNTGYRSASISHTYTFSGNLVNKASIGFNRTRAVSLQTEPFLFSDLGLNVNSEDNPPSITIGNITLGGNGQNFTFTLNTYVAEDLLTYVKGKHTLHFGGGITRAEDNEEGFQHPGTVFFQTFADFLLGFNATQNGSAALGAPMSDVSRTIDAGGPTDRAYRIRSGDAFVQDDFRITPRFTANLGFRYERVGDFWDALGRNVSFNPALANPNPPASGSLAGWVLPANYKGVVPDGAVRASNNYGTQGVGQNTINPRVGMAWQLPGTDRIVLRGGWGFFHSRVTGTPILQSFGAPPFVYVNFLAAGANANFSLNNLFAPFDISTLPKFIPYTPTSSQTALGFTNDFRPAAVQHYSLDLQTALSKDLVLDVGYVGSRDTRLLETIQVNQASLATASNPIRGQSTNTVANLPLRVPFQGFSIASMNLYASSGSSWYNALQSSLSKRFSKGLQLLASYTWARSLATGSGTSTGTLGGTIFGDQFNPPYGPDPFIREQRFVVNFSYDLPHPANAQSLVGRTLGGWLLSGVSVAQTGQRLTVVHQNDATNVFGITTDLAQYVPGCQPSSGFSLTQYINRACYTNAPKVGNDGIATTFGISPVGQITGPRQVNTDLALSKKTALWRESVSMEFRAEAFNVFNHPQFANPQTNIQSSAFGRITSTAVNPRIMQLALRFRF